MKFLITGANGQLGSELQYCLAQGKTSLGEVPAALRCAAVCAADLPELDVADRASVFAWMEREAPDIVVNCAAYTNVDGCETDPEGAFRANALGARYVAEACEKTGAKLIHLSTDYVFDGEQEVLRGEWDLPNPRSAYGKSKCLGDQYVREVCPRSFIVRTSWLYGLTGNNFVKTILKIAREKGSLAVVNDQRGNPTNAADLAHHLLKLAASEAYGLYHCTGGGICSWYDFAVEFAGLSGIRCDIRPCTTQEFPRPAPRPAYSALDNLALRCTVGDEMRHWKDAIKDYMRHYNRESGEFQR